MGIYILFAIFLTSTTIFGDVEAKVRIADMIPICDLKSADLNGCVKDSANKFIPQLKGGFRDANLPPIDPLNIPKMDLGQEQGSIYLKLELSDTVHTGLSDLHIESANIDMDTMVWKFDGVLPTYTLTGNYVGKGKILLFPLGGEGIANLTFTDLKLNLVINGTKTTITNNDHYDIKSAIIQFTFAPGKNYLDIHRLKGDMTTADSTRKFFMENADDVLNSLKKTLEDVYTEIFTGILQRLFKKVPLKRLFNNY